MMCGAAELPWPAPAALAGVKSRKRPIFQVEAGEVALGGCKACSTSGLALTLESRVVALGEGGQGAVALLLGGEEGAVSRHAQLHVAHLGPHLAGATASIQEHVTAVAAALRNKPQVVVVEEGVQAGAEAWLQTFRGLLRGEGLHSFKGAVVVCAAEETLAVRRVCCERWSLISGELRQADVGKSSLDVIEDALAAESGACTTAPQPRRRGRQAHQPTIDRDVLLEEARELSIFAFEEDLVEKARREAWTLSLLTETSPDGAKQLRGLMCHKLFPPPRAELHVTRLVVSQKHRGRGYARQLVHWLLAEAARMPLSKCQLITCSAFDGVVPFYRLFGFTPVARTHHEDEGEDSDEEGDPQTWMERTNNSLLCTA